MEPEPDPIDLAALDPSQGPRWDQVIARVASRAAAHVQLRRAAIRRARAVVLLVAAAAIALWLSPPRRPPRSDRSLLDWANRTVDADDVLALGGPDAP